MKLTESQRQSVAWNDNLLLVACPGSGKTHSIVAKLIDIGESVKDTLKGVACITYTNAAVYEIESRLTSLGHGGGRAFEVSTIHTFCLSNILGRFFWRIPHYKGGFRIASADSDEFREAVQSTCRQFKIPAKFYDQFELLNRNADGQPISKEIPPAAVVHFWHKLQSQSLIDFPNVVYESFKLLRDYPSIASSLSAKFAWILVDEFQDTSELQVEILKALHAYGRTKFFLVGDPNQSVFSFAGARPELFESFANSIAARTDIKLIDNFRSSSPIVHHAELVLPRTPPMVASGNFANLNFVPQHLIAESASVGIADYFIPLLKSHNVPISEAAVVASWWVPLFDVAQTLRGLQIPIVGPGARPYKRQLTFGVLCEYVCAYIDDREPRRLKQIAREMASLITELELDSDFDFRSYEGRILIYRFIKRAAQLRETIPLALPWLKALADELSRIFADAEILRTSKAIDFRNSAEQIKLAMVQRGVDINHFTVDQLGMFASPEKNLKLLTLHSCKGREFDAVAIIDLHDNRLPHSRAQTPFEIDEARRLFYVGVTRARKHLMFITDRGSKPSRFLKSLSESETSFLKIVEQYP